MGYFLDINNEELSSGELDYVLYDKDNKEHKKLFNELDKDEDYNRYLKYMGLKQTAYEYSKKTKEKKDIQKIPTFIVERNNTVLGVIQIHLFSDKTAIMLTTVRPKYRNMGIKKLMVLDTCEYLYNEGVEYVEFDVNPNNSSNIKSLEGINAELWEETKYNYNYKLSPDSIMYVKYKSKK